MLGPLSWVHYPGHLRAVPHHLGPSSGPVIWSRHLLGPSSGAFRPIGLAGQAQGAVTLPKCPVFTQTFAPVGPALAFKTLFFGRRSHEF